MLNDQEIFFKKQYLRETMPTQKGHIAWKVTAFKHNGIEGMITYANNAD